MKTKLLGLIIVLCACLPLFSQNNPIERMNENGVCPVPPPSNIVIPIGQEIKNKTMQGVWQTCRIEPGGNGYKLSLGTFLKFISTDNTFMNIIVDINRMGSVIVVQGEYEIKSDNIYVEKVNKSVFAEFPAGARNEITIERLHDNLIKMKFVIPGREEPGVEYWYRVPSPEYKNAGSIALTNDCV